jgi:hypothetical protein
MPDKKQAKKYPSHLIIPDTQVRVGDNLDYLSWIGEYIMNKRPDTIVMLGDFADMHSLSSYDRGKKSGEGARVTEDIAVVAKAMDVLLAPMRKYNRRMAKNKKSQYKPRMVLTLGNHENRIERYVNDNPQLGSFLSSASLPYACNGWEVVPFLEAITIDGIKYSHFFPRGANGRIMQGRNGAPNARLQVVREGMSCTAGHLQGLDWAPMPHGEGIRYGLIVGSCYVHEENYLTPQGTEYWRGIVLKNEVHDGYYDPMFISLKYLERRYGS